MADKGWGGEDEGGGTPFWDTVNDFGRAVTNAATFGMGNRAKAAIEYAKGNAPSYSAGVDEQAKASEVARERSPYASIAGDVYGSFAIPALGAERLAIRAAPAVGNVAGRALGYGATGGVTGAAAGAGNTYTGNPMDYLTNAGTGFVIGAPLGAAGGAIFGRGPAVSAAETPNAARLATERTGAYRALEQSPAQYTPASLAARADEAEQALRRQNYYNAPSNEGGRPATFRAVEQMRDPPSAVNAVTGARTHVTPADIDVIRKGVTGDRLAKSGETDSAPIVRRAIDDFIRNPPRGAVVPGTEAAARQAAALSNRAHELHGGYKRTQFMEEMRANAERQAGSTHSGLNLRNELQKAIKNRLAEKDGQSQFSRAGFNAAERAALDRFTRGQGAASQALGYADKYLGGGGGLGALAAGAAGGHYLGGDENALLKGLGTSGAGLALRMIGNRRANANINEITNMIAQRNPLYQARAARAPMVPGPGSPRTAKAMRDAVALELIKQNRSAPQGADEWE